MDGNFQLNQKDKAMDVNDRPLTMGAAYYPHEEQYMQYLELNSQVDDIIVRHERFHVSCVIFQHIAAVNLQRLWCFA